MCFAASTEGAGYLQVLGAKHVSIQNNNKLTHHYYDTGFHRPPVVLRFMCNSSCIGGAARSPIGLDFFLVDPHDNELGHITLDLKVCARPRRDHKDHIKTLSASSIPLQMPRHGPVVCGTDFGTIGALLIAWIPAPQAATAACPQLFFLQ